MRLENVKKRDFCLREFFVMKRGHTLTVDNKETFVGNIPCVNGTTENNGIICGLSNSVQDIGFELIHAPALSVGRVGFGSGVTFLQTKDFFIADNAFALVPKMSFSNEILLYFSTILNNNQDLYSYGRTVTNDYINTIIELPVKEKDESFPDWQFMENYIKSLHHKPLTTKNTPENSLDLKRDTWKEYRFGDLITDIYKAKAINKDDLTKATDISDSIHYITRTGDNNGCELLVDIKDVDPEYIEKGNAISIGDTTATCFYQKDIFITGDHMVVVRADNWLNQNTALYIVTLLNNEQFKYSYGRAFLMDRIKETKIKLPADSDGNPDWEFMENYIKSLPYGDRI